MKNIGTMTRWTRDKESAGKIFLSEFLGMSRGSLAPDQGVLLEWRKSSLEGRNWRSEKILRMTPHEEHPQGRPRIKSLDKNSFYFEQGRQEKSKGKSWLCSGKDVPETGERFCVLGREKEGRWTEKTSNYIRHFILCRSDPALLSLDRTLPPTSNFGLEIKGWELGDSVEKERTEGRE